MQLLQTCRLTYWFEIRIRSRTLR